MGNSNIIRASQNGAVMDCDLMTGLSLTGGTATDNTTVLNGLLANASPVASVKLLLDGASMVNPSLVIPGGDVTIEGNGPIKLRTILRLGSLPWVQIRLPLRPAITST